ncbi:hypothetical protein MTBPR1_140057 [Candidatus Terasakiella magnetica]|uniref:Uncharacterized protein n=1 Tax=Candidatus Terasakiella magnetica TaxID=1867952 RepID=A0A1C3RF99_9PROT|nr:hypothetical protein [Candidatus Terasakiella magnetica]SCA55939.1 hypothetical protein MTBPR1_140057 [Candidatus Terasakiella magnetica]
MHTQNNKFSWDYHFNQGVLTEKICSKERFYGCWDGFFGYWEGIEGNPSSVSMSVPFRRLLENNGVWQKPSKTLSSTDISIPENELSNWKYEADAAYAAFFGKIPSWVRRIAAPFDKFQWLVMEMIWHNPKTVKTFERITLENQTQLFFALASIQQWHLQTRTMRTVLSSEISTLDLRTELSRNCNREIKLAEAITLASLGDEAKSLELYWSLLTQEGNKVH